MKLVKGIVFLFVVIVCLAGSGSVMAGPYLSDDPDVQDYQSLLVYVYGTIERTPDSTVVSAPALEVDYGVLPNSEIDLDAPYVTDIQSGTRIGPVLKNRSIGDVELELKYRFVQEGETVPQIGVCPAIDFPTSDAAMGTGSGKLYGSVPIAIEKNMGRWIVNGLRDYWYSGWQAQYALTGKLLVGAEVWGAVGTHYTVLANAGAVWSFISTFGLNATVGHSVAGDRYFISYLGFSWAWGPKE